MCVSELVVGSRPMERLRGPSRCAVRVPKLMRLRTVRLIPACGRGAVSVASVPLRASQRRPAVLPWSTHSSGADWQVAAPTQAKDRAASMPTGPSQPRGVAALAVPDEDRAARSVKVALVQIECFADPQPARHSRTINARRRCPSGRSSGSAHYGDDLLNRWRICRVLLAFVLGRSAAVIAGIVAGERRCPAASSSRGSIIAPIVGSLGNRPLYDRSGRVSSSQCGSRNISGRVAG